MARPADLNSKRQRGFRILNRLSRSTAAKRIQVLMSELKVDKPYAETIIATHRREGKKTGAYVETYRIVDQKDGKPCKPHLSSRLVTKQRVKKTDLLTADAAKAAYMAAQEAKINLVKSL